MTNKIDVLDRTTGTSYSCGGWSGVLALAKDKLELDSNSDKEE